MALIQKLDGTEKTLCFLLDLQVQGRLGWWAGASVVVCLFTVVAGKVFAHFSFKGDF